MSTISGSIEVLLVEDNPDDVHLALHSFKKNNLGNTIHVARDGQEALDFIFAQGPYSERTLAEMPKLILLDLKLPKINGIEVLRRLKSDKMTKSIPIVVLTSSREERDIVDSYNLGVNSYIVKPVDFDKFNDAIKQLGFYWLLFNQSPPRTNTETT